MKARAPRSSNFMGMKAEPSFGNLGTWLEPESLCYPSGARLRRCNAINIETGKPGIHKCGIPDTWFSIPTTGGYISMEEGTFTFRPYNKGAV